MAKYNFKCEKCASEEVVTMSVLNYLSLDQKDVLSDRNCKKCNTVSKFVRIFNPSSSKISKSKEEILNEAKKEARNIVDKIKSGDTKTILDVYGDKA